MVAARVTIASVAGLLLWLSVGPERLFALLYGSVVALVVYLLLFLLGEE